MAARNGIAILTCALCQSGVSLAAPGYDSPALAFPGKPIRFIVPTSPGGGVDIVARAIGQRLTESWGQPVIIDNRSGAAGTIGAELAARAAPDGHTLLICTSAVLTIHPHLYPKLRYQTLRDFAPVTIASSSPFLLVVHPSLQPRTVKDLIALAKARPGQLNYSSSGNGSVTHLAGVLFNSVAGVNTVHIPYKGSSPAITDLLAGHIQMRFSATLPVLPFIRSGKLRPLAITSLRRSAQFPEVPTMAETLPGYKADIWYGVVAPAQTPPAAIARLHAEIVRELRSEPVKAKLEADGSDVVANSPAEFAAVMRADYQRWAAVIKEAGVRAED
jgi:tripartite-type tricarboxylate transporter receptor subunit TctC